MTKVAAETNDCGTMALDFVERLDSLHCQNDVIDALGAAFSEFGFDHFIITGLPTPDQTFEQAVVLRKWPAGWFDLYASRQYVRVDPVIRMCRNSVQPFEWTEAPYDPDREPRAHELMMRARDFGLARGFSLPVHGIGYEACFSMSGCNLDLSNRTKPAIHLMAMYAFERSRRIAERRRPPLRNPLSSREQEVLKWAAAGKTASDTAERLGVTERTVTAHIAGAMQKLGASNKTHAVGRAVAMRYIAL